MLQGRRIRDRLDWRGVHSPGCIEGREGRAGRGGSLRGILQDELLEVQAHETFW